MVMSLEIDGVYLLHVGAVAAIASLGDLSFYLTLIFGTWCPFQGVREMRGATCQRLFVWVGMVIAFVGRAILVKVGMQFELVDTVCGSCGTVLLLLMALKSSTDLGSKTLEKRAAEQREHLTEKESDWKKKKPDAQSASGSIMSTSLSVLMTTAATGFVIFPDGQIDRRLLQGAKAEWDSWDFTVGSIAGYAVAMLIAVLIGSILERTVPVKRLLFCNAMGLACMCLWVGSFMFAHIHDMYIAPHWPELEAAYTGNKSASLLQSSSYVDLGSSDELASIRNFVYIDFGSSDGISRSNWYARGLKRA